VLNPKSCHDSKLENHVSHVGIALREEVDDRPGFFDSQAHTPHILVHLTSVESTGQLEGVLLGVKPTPRRTPSPAGPQT